MQRIKDTTIELTRGDILNFDLTLQLEDGTNYEFKANDKIKFAVYLSKKMDVAPVLQKVITVSEPSEIVTITCTSDETKIGDYINSPLECWYEIVLNDENTVIGFDKEGPKILKLYPEGYEESPNGDNNGQVNN